MTKTIRLTNAQIKAGCAHAGAKHAHTKDISASTQTKALEPKDFFVFLI